MKNPIVSDFKRFSKNRFYTKSMFWILSPDPDPEPVPSLYDWQQEQQKGTIKSPYIYHTYEKPLCVGEPADNCENAPTNECSNKYVEIDDKKYQCFLDENFKCTHSTNQDGSPRNKQCILASDSADNSIKSRTLDCLPVEMT